MAQDEIVEIASGKVRGVNIGGIKVFKGIPYGGPVAEAGRFRPPVPPASWPGVRDALDYGPTAFQDPDAFMIAPQVLEVLPLREAIPMNENCLVLNVWTPALNDNAKRPVMFWCHGGAFIAGSGSSLWNDGTNLSRNGDVVVVTINHRLGAFGYLHLQDLGGDEFASSGNAGMLDIVLALQWIRENIVQFGGDPGNVTIFGESGGGAKVSVLMGMPAARGLFHKAIIQSGPAVEMMSRADATATAEQVLTELGLQSNQVNQLRRIPAERLLDAQRAILRKFSLMSFANRRRIGFNPVVDGKNLPAGPFEPVAPAVSSEMPLIIGTNKDEMTLFFAFAPWMKDLNETGLRERVGMMMGERADSVLAGYRRARPHDSPGELLLAIATDAGIRMPSLVIAERKVALRGAPVLEGRLKSPHALEIPFVFNTLESSPLAGDSPTRFALAEKMSRTWIAFARTGNPDNGALPHWPAYSVAERPTMIFDDECHVISDPYGQERLAWNK
jgi:para-nitrobenzyl esterase